MSRRTELVAAVDGIDEIRTTRYRCQGCGRTAAKRKSLEGHKENCWKHPDNKGCGSCAHVQRHYDEYSTKPRTVCSIGLTPVTVERCWNCTGGGHETDPFATSCAFCKDSGQSISLTFNCPSWSTDLVEVEEGDE